MSIDPFNQILTGKTSVTLTRILGGIVFLEISDIISLETYHQTKVFENDDDPFYYLRIVADNAEQPYHDVEFYTKSQRDDELHKLKVLLHRRNR